MNEKWLKFHELSCEHFPSATCSASDRVDQRFTFKKANLTNHKQFWCPISSRARKWLIKNCRKVKQAKDFHLLSLGFWFQWKMIWNSDERKKVSRRLPSAIVQAKLCDKKRGERNEDNGWLSNRMQMTFVKFEREKSGRGIESNCDNENRPTGDWSMDDWWKVPN